MRGPVEPTLAAYPGLLMRYFAATRPAFLLVTVVGTLLGLACAHYGGMRLQLVTAALTLLLALVTHAGANVLNDYFDAQSGTDASNTERLYPFTGGSRFIQNGVLTRRATGIFGYTLLAAVVPAGLWLTLHSAPALLWIGLCGLLVGWAYSAPPLQLVSRGLGEIVVTCGWALLVVGTDFVQRRAFAFQPVAAGLSYAVLVANLLYINQFPDAKADAVAGKLTLVARLGWGPARWGYALLIVLAGSWNLGVVASGCLPALAMLSLVPFAASIAAARILWRAAGQPARLEPAIKLTILAAAGHGLVLAAVLVTAAVRGVK